MTFRDREKKRYEATRHTLFGPEASGHGTYRGISRPFCLPDDHSSHNLYDGIREEAITYFSQRSITWHDGRSGRSLPSNHLCCSQSCCVNFLFPLATRPDLLQKVLTHIYPDVKEVLPFEGDRISEEDRPLYLAFEWIGLEDYLGEHGDRPGARTRGKNYTSVDFAFRYRRDDGRIHLILGEWKYTENADSTDYGTSNKASDRKPERRKSTYWPAFTRPGGFFDGYGEDLYHALFFGATYQWFRLELLAQEMEIKEEADADVVSVLWVCPEANAEFREKATIPTYLKDSHPGSSLLEIWGQLVGSQRFQEISSESLRDILLEVGSGEGDDVQSWAEYLDRRYGW